jgi:hypothetical protein
MFVLTVDQIGSRTSRDLVREIDAELRGRFADELVLGPDRTAGDEFEVVVKGAAAALRMALHLNRLRTWSVGVGVGPVDLPLPATAREATGNAFVLARDAVDRAKRRPHRLALAAGASAGPLGGEHVEAVLELLLAIRDRRSAEGWEVADLLEREGSQVAVAARLGVTPQAVSLRARVAGLREELDALPAVTALLAALDGASA